MTVDDDVIDVGADTEIAAVVAPDNTLFPSEEDEDVVLALDEKSPYLVPNFWLTDGFLWAYIAALPPPVFLLILLPVLVVVVVVVVLLLLLPCIDEIALECVDCGGITPRSDISFDIDLSATNSSILFPINDNNSGSIELYRHAERSSSSSSSSSDGKGNIERVLTTASLYCLSPRVAS